MSHVEMFPLGCWNLLYPPQQVEKTVRYKNCELHFKLALAHFLVNKQSVDHLFQSFIKEAAKHQYALLVAKDPNFFYTTPLHIAAMKGNLAAVEALVEAYQSKSAQQAVDLLNCQDQFGWTALHFSRITSRPIYDFLISKGARKIQNGAGATPDLLDVCLGRTRIQNSSNLVFFEQPGFTKKSLAEMTSTELRELMGLESYTDRVVYPPEEWDQLWQQNKRIYDQRRNDLMKSFLIPKLSQFPHLLVSPSLELGSGHFSVRAAKKIKEYEVICILSGQRKVMEIQKSLTSLLVPCKKLHWLYLDFAKAGNVSRWINAGWPNAMRISIKNFEGAVLDSLIACEEINDGKEILMDYGSLDKDLMWGKYCLLNREEMRSWFKKTSLIDLLKLAKKEFDLPGRTMTQILRSNMIGTRINFIFNTPAALLDLVFSGISSIHQWIKIYEDSEHPIMQVWFAFYGGTSKEILGFLYRIKQFQEIVPIPIRPDVDYWIVNNIGKLAVIQLLKGMEEIQLACKKNKLDLTDWHDLKIKLDVELPLHDWSPEDKAFLHIKD